MRRSSRILTLLAAVLLSACTTAPRAPSGWMTSGDGAQRLAPMEVGAWRPAAEEARAIHVDPSQTYQTMSGFGASVTDSSAWLIQHSLDDTQRAALMAELFGRDGGLGLSATRITIGASDFSRAHYSYRDAEAAAFDIAPARLDVVPTVRAAAALNPNLTIIASPWSAPAWMKTSNSLITGGLAHEHYPDFARYLADYVVQMRALGVSVDALTIQNEPHFEPADYPGMRMSPSERAAFVGGHLGPLLERERLDVDILEWDHNWNEPESPLAALSDPVAARYIDGVAWHCYGGEVSAQSQVQALHPDKDVWMTECSGGAWDANWRSSLIWMMRNLVIGTTRNWARGVILWNIALDETSGPHLGGCGNCRGVVTIDQETGEVTRNVEYYVLGHASRFVAPGARRIASDTDVDGLESVAFINARDRSTALIVLNGSDEERAFSIVVGGRAFDANLSSGSVATFTWSN
ncbi:MAG: hypothetical protein JNM59_07140 [Hyphomonadaceae bacterium]|nr:hypothetical protein [Hyphomonadaceae bacterium]